MKARTPLAALAALAAAAAVPSAALGAGIANAPAAPAVALPGDAGAAAVRADPRTWIVGLRAGRPAARRIARSHGASRIAGSAWLAPRNRARALATELRDRGLLDYAEPNRIGRRAQAPAPDPLSPHAGWRDHVVGAAVPPPVTPASPLIAFVDTQIDVTHPEIAGSNITTAGGPALSDFHGTATSTVAAAPANLVGMLGIWPGARTVTFALPDGNGISCEESVRGIAGAIRAHAAVINMSYGAASKCIAEEQEIQRAIRAGAVPVAASGNEFDQGNPLEFPASLAHVLTVSAIAPDDKPAYFSSESVAVDLTAPGASILTAVPAAFDPDGDGDGFAVLDGTSFAAPMVSAAVAWVRAARPDLTPFQSGQVVRLGVTDIGAQGYDNATGFGLLNLPRALAFQAPADDPLEPNDDIRYVNGRAFGKPVPALYTGMRTSLAATADYAEDPVDVYRINIRARRLVRLALTPSVGDPDLFVFGPGARSVRGSRVIRSSARSGSRTDRVTIRNRGRATRTVYAAVGFEASKRLRLLNATYVLSAR